MRVGWGIAATVALLVGMAGCGSAAATQQPSAVASASVVSSDAASTTPAPTSPPSTTSADAALSSAEASLPPEPASSTAPSTAGTPGSFTFAFAGDVNFADRTADRLAADPATAFGVAAAELDTADLTMVNLETAITTGGAPEAKQFTFRAPPSALTALSAAGIDVASMANNHAADYGPVGLQDSLAAIATSEFPVIGIGADDTQAFAPYATAVNGLTVAVFAATQVPDHTLAYFSAGPGTPGVANANSDLLVSAVRAAAAQYDVVVVYLHWGTEYESCPNGDQEALAGTLAEAGATAVVGTHAHVLQGAGWRPDGVYVAYGLSNYLWWKSLGNESDDNGVLTLTFGRDAVTAASFAPAHLDDTGVPVPATGAEKERIDADWEQARQCAGLDASPS